MPNLIDKSAQAGDELALWYVPLDELINSFAAGNPKLHDIGGLCESFARHGFRDPMAFDPALNDGAGGIVEGNGRLEALLQLKEQGHAPPRGIKLDGNGDWYVPLLFGVGAGSQAAAEGYLLDHNNSVLAGGTFTALDTSNLYDPDAYRDLLERLAAEDALPLTVDDKDFRLLLEQLGKGGGAGGEGLIDPDEVPDGENVETRCKRGDIWALGSHRVMCGDSTNREDVEQLMCGRKADMVFTDPPYGVSIGDKNAFLNKLQPSERCLENINDDTLPPDKLKPILIAAFRNLKAVSSDKCAYYVTAPLAGKPGMIMMTAMEEVGLQVRHVLFWDKQQPTFSMGQLDYEYRHEPILYTWNKTHKFYGKGEHKTSVWSIPKPRQSKLHPTMKPVELIKNALLNGSKSGDLVADIYLGSGSTLIACQEAGRVCYGMEISEKYCDVILARWEAFTGQVAGRVGTA
ncbi:MAG: DNA modification methylase [Spirulinaceae cyanobacterium SM2_1_0]|nr:DNA modification methylase [Spirulinaceae cyanobacterium SM2_1_0]